MYNIECRIEFKMQRVQCKIKCRMQHVVRMESIYSIAYIKEARACEPPGDGNVAVGREPLHATTCACLGHSTYSRRGERSSAATRAGLHPCRDKRQS